MRFFPWQPTQFEKDATILLTAMRSTLIDIKAQLATVNMEESKIMATIEEIKIALDKLVTDVQTAITDIQDLSTQLAAAIANQADPAALQAIADEITTTTTNLEAALPKPPA